jgi:hypothetical protein
METKTRTLNKKIPIKITKKTSVRINKNGTTTEKIEEISSNKNK